MRERIYTHPIGAFSANIWGDYDTLALRLTRNSDDPPYLQDDSEWRLQSSKGTAPKVLDEDELAAALHWIFMKNATLAMDK